MHIVKNKPKFIEALKSAAAALFGVQQADKYQQDFQSQSPLPFVIAGVIMTLGLIFALVVIVYLVLS